MELEAITEPQAFDRLEQDWSELYRRAQCKRFSQTFAWAKQSWEQVAGPGGWSLAIVVGREKGRAVLIWPLVVGRHYAWRQARWLGPGASEYVDVLMEDSAEKQDRLRNAWQFFRASSGVDFILCQWIRQDAAVFDLVQSEPKIVINRVVAPFVDITAWPNWDSYISSFRSGYLKDKRRRWRRLSECGSVSAHEAQSNEEIDEALSWMFRHKRAWLERTKMVSFWLVSKSYQAFLSAVTKEALAAGCLRMFTLRLDDRIIAAELGFVTSDQVETLFTSYDREYRKFGPGGLLFERYLERAFEEGNLLIDLRLGQEPHKSIWANGQIDVFRCFFPLTRWGNIYCWWRNAKLREFLLKANAMRPLKALAGRVRKAIRGQ